MAGEFDTARGHGSAGRRAIGYRVVRAVRNTGLGLQHQARPVCLTQGSRRLEGIDSGPDHQPHTAREARRKAGQRAGDTVRARRHGRYDERQRGQPDCRHHRVVRRRKTKRRHVIGKDPADFLSFAPMGRTVPGIDFEHMQHDVVLGIGVLDADQGDCTHQANAELLFEFTREAVHRPFAGFELATGELPAPPLVAVSRSQRQ